MGFKPISTTIPLVAHTLEIAKVRPKVLRNWMKRFNTENWVSFCIMLCLILFFWFGGFYFFRFLASNFHKIPTVGDILINRIIAFLFLALFMMTAFSDLVTALSTMYLSKDLPLLHSYPVNPVAIFAEKYMQTVYYGAWAVVCFGLPIYFAYGATMHAPWYFYPIAILSNIPFLIISAGVSILLTLILAYILPANRARTMIVALYGLSFVAVILYLRLLRTQQMVGPGGNDTAINQYLFNLQLTTNPYLPSYWITHVFSAAVEGNLSDLFFYFSLLCVTALFVIQVGCQLAYKLYYPGWTKSCESVQGTVTQKKWRLDKIFFKLFDIFRPPVRAIIVKDIKIFWRDLTQWGQFTLLLTLVFVYLINTRNAIKDTGLLNQAVFNLPLKSLLGLFNLALVGFVLANLAMRFVFTMISLEGRIIWVIRSSPIRLTTLFWVKYLLALITMLAVGGVLISLANYLLQIDPLVGIISLVCVILMSVALTSIAMGLGAMFPTFNVENPMQLSAGTGSVLTVVLSLLYIMATIFLAAQPMIPYFLNGANVSFIPLWAILFPLIAGLVLNFVAILTPIHLGINRLEKRER
jgi:ABC-2 type transport system permease protein